MADNSTLPVNTGTEVFANDDIGGIKYPRVKITWGVDGASVDASASNPVPISDAGGSLTVDGAVTISGTVTTAIGSGTQLVNTELGQLFGVTPAGSHEGTPTLVQRQDTPAGIHANGTYTFLRSDADGKLWTNSGAQLGGMGANTIAVARVAIVDEQTGTLKFGAVPVISGARDWKVCPANATTVLETSSGTGASGDVLETIFVYVANAAAAQIMIGDGVTPATVIFPAAPASGINTYQYTYAIESKAGSWRVTCATGVSAMVTGRWT